MVLFKVSILTNFLKLVFLKFKYQYVKLEKKNEELPGTWKKIHTLKFTIQ